VRRLRPLERALLGVHVVLLLATAAAVLSSELATGWRIGLLVAGSGPLLAVLPGLYEGRLLTYQWTALAMVLFAGAAAVEVVATLGRSAFASVVLLAALVELGLLFILSRRARG
jgi:hypothetical protein